MLDFKKNNNNEQTIMGSNVHDYVLLGSKS